MESKLLVPHELPRTGQVTSYRAGDDGAFRAGWSGPNRFRDNGDGTVLDFATGLMWVKDPVVAPGAPFNAQVVWNAAIDNCLALDFAGHTDWRLPNLKELLSSVDYSENNPAIDGTVFPNTEWAAYWTSSSLKSTTTDGWCVVFSDGQTFFEAKAINPNWVRPVRGGITL